MRAMQTATCLLVLACLATPMLAAEAEVKQPVLDGETRLEMFQTHVAMKEESPHESLKWSDCSRWALHLYNFKVASDKYVIFIKT